MLTLARKEGERILIDGGIVILVRKIKGRYVSLSIEAPKEVAIVRDDAKRKEAA